MPSRIHTRRALRVEFVVLATGGALAMSELCRRFGVSRQTGYKWFARFKAGGEKAREDRFASPAPIATPHRRAGGADGDRATGWRRPSSVTTARPDAVWGSVSGTPRSPCGCCGSECASGRDGLIPRRPSAKRSVSTAPWRRICAAAIPGGTSRMGPGSSRAFVSATTTGAPRFGRGEPSGDA